MSKRLSRVIVLSLAVLLIASGPSAAASSGADVKGVGGGWLGVALISDEKFAQFSFSAHSGPNGDFGQARFMVPNFPLDVTIAVDCLNAVPFPPFGGAAWFSGVVTRVDPPGAAVIFPGDRHYWFIIDAGEPSDRPIDRLDIYPVDFGESCKVMAPYPSVADVTHGNIVIGTD